MARLLKSLNFSLQSNSKTLEGTQHADRDAQFRYINARSKKQLKAGNPAISVDRQKKELVGEFKNVGAEYRPKGKPEKVNGHHFKGELGRVSPYGIYDIQDNSGWVSVGISADTSEFAVETIRPWWNEMGYERYSHASERIVKTNPHFANRRPYRAVTRPWRAAWGLG